MNTMILVCVVIAPALWLAVVLAVLFAEPGRRDERR